jgi:hypothetical protein
MMIRTMVPPLVALLMTAALAACASSEGLSASAQQSNGSGGATTTVSGRFALLPSAPPGFDGLRGTAKLVRSEGGTDWSIELRGLQPNVKYMSHVHARACDQPNPGGPHFRFDRDGGDAPANEMHLAFGSDAAGNGGATAHFARAIRAGEGRSVVVHQDVSRGGSDSIAADSASSHHGAPGKGSGERVADSPPKLACAPLGPGSSTGRAPDRVVAQRPG